MTPDPFAEWEASLLTDNNILDALAELDAAEWIADHPTFGAPRGEG